MEAVALAASVDINHLLESVMLALQAKAVNTVKIIAIAHPAITQARVVFGQMPLGERDRTALDTAMGLRSSPKAPTFIGKAIFGSGRNVMEAQGTGREDDDSARRETTTVPIWISSFRLPTPAGATRSDPAADAATRRADIGQVEVSLDCWQPS